MHQHVKYDFTADLTGTSDRNKWIVVLVIAVM